MAPPPGERDRPHLDLDRPFLTRSFRAAGHDPVILRSREYRQVLTGVWVRAAAYDWRTAARAALLIHPDGAFISHVSAAALLGLPVPDHAFIHVSVDQAADRRYRRQIKSHVISRPRRVVTAAGLPVTDPIATFIDSAGMLSYVDLVVLGDAICRKFDLGAEQLREACRRSRDYYAGLARAAAELVRDGVDSPMETRLRVLIVLAGLPEPQVNVIVRDEHGHWVRRFDLYYESIGLVVEYDGRQHADDPAQWQSDIDRREELDDDGRRLIIVTARGIFHEPERTLERIRRQLVLRGWGRVPPIGDGWRAHFA
jgi:hypothetical protein